MSKIVSAALLLAGAIHLAPVIGVLGPDRLASLYGLDISEPNLAILMRHRAVLFGLLGAFLVFAAFRRALHGTALVTASVSVLAFLGLAWSVGSFNAHIARVITVDLVALGALVIGGVAHMMERRNP